MRMIFKKSKDAQHAALKKEAKAEKAEKSRQRKAERRAFQQSCHRIAAEVRALKSRARKTHHARVPGYLIVGAQGAGKSRLIELSGLRFVYQSRWETDAHEAPFLWSVATEGVCVEIPAAWFLHESPRDEAQWQYFLKKIRRLSHWDFQGVLLTAPLSRFRTLHPTPEESQALQALSQREGCGLEDIQKALRYRLTLYRVLTHWDQLSGFQAWSQGLVGEGRAQRLGVDLPWEGSKQDFAARLHQGFSECLDRISLFALTQLQYHAPYAAHEVYHVAHQFAEIQPALHTWGLSLPKSQGLYGVAMPVDAVSGYFTEGLFRSLCARPRVDRGSRQRWLQLLSIVGISSGILIFWLISYHTRLSEHQQVLTRLVAFSPPDPNPHSPACTTDLESLYRLHSSEHQEFESGLWPFAFSPDSVRYQVLQSYQKSLIFCFLPKVQEVIVSHLHHSESLSHWLALDMMLEHPEYRKFYQPQWYDQWYDRHDKNLQKKWLQDLLAVPRPLPGVPQRWVHQAREALAQQSIVREAYQQWKASALSASSADLFFLIPQSSFESQALWSPLTVSLRIPRIFTRAGYRAYYQAQAAQVLQAVRAQRWMLGKEGEVQGHRARLADQIHAMKGLYGQDDVHAWQLGLKAVRWAPLGSLDNAALALQVLGSSRSPLKLLLQRVIDNTPETFSDPYFESLTRFCLPQKIKLKSLKKNHKTPLASTLQAISALGDYVNGIANDSNPPLAAYQAALSIVKGTPNPAIAHFKAMASEAPVPVREWLNRLLGQVYQTIFSQADQYLNTLWQSQVRSFYQEALQGRYPLDLKGQTEVSLSDFTHFFAPKTGLLDQFVQTYLSPFLMQNSSGKLRWIFISKIPLSRNLQLLKEISQGEAISQGLFQGAHGAFGFSLVLRSDPNWESSQRVTFQQNKKTIGVLSLKSRTLMLTWPFSQSAQPLEMIESQGWLHRDLTQSFSGTFSGVRLFESLTHPKSKSFKITASADSLQTRLGLQALSGFQLTGKF